MTTTDPAQSSPLALRARGGEAVRTPATAGNVRRLSSMLSLAAPGIVSAGGMWLLWRGGPRRAAGAGALAAAAGIGLARWQLQRYFTEHVAYELEATVGRLELRAYPARVWVETVVEKSPWRQALNEGFRRLAAYLSGANGTAERFPMTTPVLASLPPPSDRDAPEAGAAELNADVTVAFALPARRSLRDLPLSRDRRVRLRTVPERLVAALRFRGNFTRRPPSSPRDELLAHLRAAAIRCHGEPRFAAYDPPGTLPWLRRNEVMVDL